MRKMAFLVGLVAAGAMVSTACVTKIDTDPPGTGASGGAGGSGGGSGGTDTSTHDQLYGSGSRLQAVYTDAGGGAERFTHFHDADLDQSCAFGEAADGALRCLPRTQATLFYTDAGCSDPIVVVRACDATLPAHVSVASSDACRDSNIRRSDAYTVGDAATPTMIYRDLGAGCTEDLTFDSMNDLVYEVAPSDDALFAEGTVTALEADGGLGQRVATTEGGAHQVLGAYNIARDENCSGMAIGEDTLCLSANLAYGTIHSSTVTCDENDVAYGQSPSECGEPQAIVKVTEAADACDPSTLSVHALADAIDVADVYVSSIGSCEAATETANPYYEIGGEAMEGVLPTLSAAAQGDGRLTMDIATTPDGVPMAYAADAAQFMDTERDATCWAQETADGTKCLPFVKMYADTGTGYFSNDTCTDQIVDVALAACADAPPALVGFRAAPSGTCANYSLETLYAVGVEYTGGVYADNGGGCALVPVDGLNFYELGAETPLSDFATLTQITQTDAE